MATRKGTGSRTPAPATLSAGVIPVLRGLDGYRYLVLRAYNYWDFPKGVVAAGEDPLDAALRELREETTLVEAELRWGHSYRETPPYSRNKVARYYLAEVKQREVSLPINPYLGMPEHHEFRWASYEEARALVSDRVKPILDWAHERIK